jgi:hypothetical protein
MRMTRRSLLGAGARSGLVLGGLLVGCRPGGPDAAGRAALIAFASEVSGASRLGGAYLEEHSNEASVDALANSLLDGVPTETAASVEALASLLRQRNQRDFEEGDVLQLDGWIVGRTEARLYALASLSREQ